VRYARRAPGRLFGAGRSLGHDGQVGPPMYDAAIGQVVAPTPDQPQTLGATAGAVGVRLVRGGARVIAAWPDPAAGGRIATRPA
jgi:hypothetical protein